MGKDSPGGLYHNDSISSMTNMQSIDSTYRKVKTYAFAKASRPSVFAQPSNRVKANEVTLAPFKDKSEWISKRRPTFDKAPRSIRFVDSFLMPDDY